MSDYAVLKGERNYFRRLYGQLVSRFGDSIDQITFGWIMYEVTGSASMIALIMFFNFLPNIILQPFVGVLVERMSKRKVIMICDIGRGVIVSTTILLYTFGLLNPVLLICITLCNSTLESFNQPASSAIIPYLLKGDQYDVGIALNNSLVKVAELIGTAAAGGLIALIGVQGALAIDAAAFLFSAVINATLRIQEEKAQDVLTVKSYFGQLTDGFKILKGSKIICMFIVAASLLNFAISPINAFQTVYVAEDLRFGPGMLSAFGASLMVGMVLGSVLSPKVKDIIKGRALLFTGGMVMSAAIISYWLIPMLAHDVLRIGALVFATFALGFVVGILNVVVGSKMMQEIPKEYLARIQSVAMAVSVLMVPIGSLICSGLATFLSVPVIFMIFGVFMAAAFCFGLLVKEFDNI